MIFYEIKYKQQNKEKKNIKTKDIKFYTHNPHIVNYSINMFITLMIYFETGE